MPNMKLRRKLAEGDFGHIIPHTSKEGNVMHRIIFTALIAVVAMMGLTTPASANQRFLPEGISAVSPTKAKAQVLDYSEINVLYGNMIASETGARSFNRKDYHQRGYSTAPANTHNTSQTASGGNARSSGAVGTKTLVLVNIKTGKTVHVMVRCANPRLKKGGKCDCKPVRVKKLNQIRVNKPFKRTVTKKCPSGQPVTVTVKGRVVGWVRGRLTGTVIGSAKLFFRNEVDLRVTAQITVVCGLMPAPPGQSQTQQASNDCPPGEQRNSQNVCVIVQQQCQAGWVRDAAGVCVNQSNTAAMNCTAKGGKWSDVEQTCTIIQVNGVCSNIIVINGDGNTVNTYQEGNCNKQPPTCQERGDCPPPPPPPKCPDGRPIPSNGDCDRLPQVQITGIPHLTAPNAYGEGAENGKVYLETSDPDGDVQSVDIEEVSGGHHADWTSLIDTAPRWNTASCPTGKTCWRFTLWAKSPGTYVFRAKVSAGGKIVYSENQTVEIAPFSF